MKTTVFLIVSSFFGLSCGFAFASSNLAIETDFEDRFIQDSSRSLAQKFPNLARDAEAMIIAESSFAMSQLKEKGKKRILIDSPSFSPRGTMMIASVSFLDGQAPRPITMFVDAYGDAPFPLASFPYNFESTGVRQPIMVSVKNLPAFKRFELRFTHEGRTLQSTPTDPDFPRISPLNPNAMLFHSDYSELRDLLEGLGYIKTKSFEPSAMYGAVRRFRIDYGLDGPEFATLRDLFALRIVSGLSQGKTTLLPYVEWSSGSDGGWSEPQKEFIDENLNELTGDDLIKSEDQSQSEDEIYHEA